MSEKAKRRKWWYIFFINTFSRVKDVMRYWERRTAVCVGAYRIGHLVHVAILTSHWGGVLTNSFFRCYALYPSGIVLLQSKALGFHWDLNLAIFCTTNTKLCLSHLCLFGEKNCKRRPNLTWQLRVKKSRVQSLDLIHKCQHENKK